MWIAIDASVTCTCHARSCSLPTHTFGVDYLNVVEITVKTCARVFFFYTGCTRALRIQMLVKLTRFRKKRTFGILKVRFGTWKVKRIHVCSTNVSLFATLTKWHRESFPRLGRILSSSIVMILRRNAIRCFLGTESFGELYKKTIYTTV